MAAAKLTTCSGPDERGEWKEWRGDLQSVSRVKKKLLGSSLDGSGEDKGGERAAGAAGDEKASGGKRWNGPLNMAGSKDRLAKRSASPRAMLGVDGKA